MNDQEKREKVINKVKAIVADMQEEVDEWKDYSDSELRGGLTCDCDWWYKTLQTLKDALALLKAQEPRVMTISDFKDEGVYYLEALPPFVLRPVIYRLDKSDPRHYNFVWKYDQFTWNTDEYGKTWRCWTSRPTDEQRGKVKWDSQGLRCALSHS